MRKNDEIILEITDITNDGSGVGKSDGMAVFVPLTAVGDIAKIKVLKTKKSYAYGKLIDLVKASDSRIIPDCPTFNLCGGCAFRHINYVSELELKQNKVYEALKRIGGIDLKPNSILFGNNTENYRNKAQYPISQDGKMGFYAFHSHRIIPCNDCKLQPNEFTVAVQIFKKWIKEHNISIYDEISHTGLLRHIYLRKAEKTEEIMVTVVINGDTIPFADELIFTLKEELGLKLKSVQLNINKEKTNVILGEKCVKLFGENYITDILCGIKVRISPLSFYQVNRKMAEQLYRKAVEYAEPKGKNILDIYCGAGTIGLSMASQAKSIIGVEIVPQAVKDAESNAEINQIKNARFICADALQAAKQLAEEKVKSDVVIIDPPRKGCSEELINTITDEFKPERVVYVSCDPATFARDVKIFNNKGYKLCEYTPCDLFPRTSHVETVALLSR